MEPNEELRQLHQRILAGDPHLAAPAEQDVVPARRPDPVRPDPVNLVPRQLPAAVARFAGRLGELRILTGLAERAARGTGGTVMISTIGGMAGVGKTALAVYFAHQVARLFQDGQLYVDLRGFGPAGEPVPSGRVLRGFLYALGVAPQAIPADADADAQAGLYRSLMSGKNMLVVLDNARDAEQVRPLLPGSPGCLVLITSRSRLAGLVASEGAHHLSLDLLSDAEAHELLAQRLGAARVGAAPGVAAELIRACARLPLALAIAAACISARPQLGLGGFADELRDARGRLDALDTWDDTASVRAVFSWSLGNLSAPAGRLFGLLGLHPGPDITISSAASLARMPRPQARRALDELAQANLITEHAPTRFVLHDLLRAYACEQAATYDAEEQRAAVKRMLDYYLHTLSTAHRMLYPARDPLVLPAAQADAMTEALTDTQQTKTWLAAERRVLLAAAAQAAELSFHAHAWQIPYYLAIYLDLHGYWAEWAATQQTALISAQRLGDMTAQARIHLISSHVCVRLGAEQDAETHLASALGLYQQLQDPVGQARIHVAFSLALNHQGKHGGAFGHAQHALILYWSAGHRAGMAAALNALGWTQAHLANPQRAVACCQRAIRLHRETGNKLGQAEGWDSLGYAYHQLGDHGQAIECYERAIRAKRELASRHHEAGSRSRLGDVFLAAGDLERARRSWELALAVYEEEHHPHAGTVRRRLQYLGSAVATKVPASIPFFEPIN